MSIAFFEVREEWEREAIQKAFPKKKLYIFEDTLEEVDLTKYKGITVISVFVYSQCSKKNLSQLPKLKMISVRGTGYDQVDLTYCKKNNITVTNVPAYGESTVAEFTLGLLLAITRKIPESIARVRSGIFDFSGLRGTDLNGKTIGLIGFGRIGQKFAKMCQGLEMNVLVYDMNKKFAQEKAKEIGVEVATLTKIYKEADIISLHLPLTPKTKHFIKKDTIEKMKDGVILLNSARGDLIKSRDLLLALRKGKVSFAGLDVIEGETMIKDELELMGKVDKKHKKDYELLVQDHILMDHPKALVTPHNAFNTIDALQRIINTSNDNIKKYLTKKDLGNTKVI